MTRVFIDGEAGTTGLQIRERLTGRRDIELLSIAPEKRKDEGERKRLLNAAEVAILCLPDEAAKASVAMIENPRTRVIDASTAHRVAPGWTYGFPEMTCQQAELIRASKRVANVGCYASAAVALIRPLVDAGLLPAGWPVTLNAVSGYSGGGRQLIESYEDPKAPNYAPTPFWLYGLGLKHKHLPEIQVYGRLEQAPLFVPSVGKFAQGMLVSLPLPLWSLPGRPDAAAIRAVLARHYGGQRFVTLQPEATPDRLDPEVTNGTNEMRLYVFANPAADQALLVAQLDNLGKGASGAAVQNLNLMIGAAEDEGLAQAA